MPSPRRFEISATPAEAADLAERIDRACRAVPGADGEAVDALRLCLAEALNNIVEHAYAGAGGTIVARLWVIDGRAAVLLADCGGPMPGGTPPGGVMPGAGVEIDTLPEGGFGWSLIRSQADVVGYRCRQGYNFLRLGKRLAPPAGGQRR